jgi:uncharacterized protein (DUF302 family)
MRRNAYGFSVESDLGVDEADATVRELLKEQGFGVLTEIDVRKTLREKLNADFREYRILGACNPPLAQQALEAEPLIGLLLPCNVVVEARLEGGSRVSFLDPLVALGMVGNPKLQPVAVDAAARLKRVADSIERSRTSETNQSQRR